MEESILFFGEEIEIPLQQPTTTASWLQQIAIQYEASIEGINYIFCTDEYLLDLNRSYLDHDYYTDILTFPYSPPSSRQLISDIYISVERVQDNAAKMAVSFEEELHRVMVHGLLHLLGFDDHGEVNKLEMRRREEEALQQRS